VSDGLGHHHPEEVRGSLRSIAPSGHRTTQTSELQTDPKVTSHVVRSSRGRCTQHLHDVHDAHRTSYANLARNISVTYAPDSRRMRVTSANSMQMYMYRGSKSNTLCGMCAQHFRPIRGCDARTRRERTSGVNQAHMSRKIRYDVRHHVARVAYIMQMLRAPAVQQGMLLLDPYVIHSHKPRAFAIGHYIK
jgi:hypothetical protein